MAGIALPCANYALLISPKLVHFLGPLIFPILVSIYC